MKKELTIEHSHTSRWGSRFTIISPEWMQGNICRLAIIPLVRRGYTIHLIQEGEADNEST